MDMGTQVSSTHMHVYGSTPYQHQLTSPSLTGSTIISGSLVSAQNVAVSELSSPVTLSRTSVSEPR